LHELGTNLTLVAFVWTWHQPNIGNPTTLVPTIGYPLLNDKSNTILLDWGEKGLEGGVEWTLNTRTSVLVGKTKVCFCCKTECKTIMPWVWLIALFRGYIYPTHKMAFHESILQARNLETKSCGKGGGHDLMSWQVLPICWYHNDFLSSKKPEFPQIKVNLCVKRQQKSGWESCFLSLSFYSSNYLLITNMWSTHFHDEEKPNEENPSQWSYYPKLPILKWNQSHGILRIEELGVWIGWLLPKLFQTKASKRNPTHQVWGSPVHPRMNFLIESQQRDDACTTQEKPFEFTCCMESFNLYIYLPKKLIW
jgi:hypothetical protein